MRAEQRLTNCLDQLTPVFTSPGFRPDGEGGVYVECLGKSLTANNPFHLTRVFTGKAYRGWLRSQRQQHDGVVRLRDLPSPPDIEERLRDIDSVIRLHFKLVFLLGWPCPSVGRALDWVAARLGAEDIQEAKVVIAKANAAKHAFRCDAGQAAATAVPVTPVTTELVHSSVPLTLCTDLPKEPCMEDVVAEAVATPPASAAEPAPCTPPPLSLVSPRGRACPPTTSSTPPTSCGPCPGDGGGSVRACAGEEPAESQHHEPQRLPPSEDDLRHYNDILEEALFFVQQACDYGGRDVEDLVAEGIVHVDSLIDSTHMFDWLGLALRSGARDLVES